LLAIKQLKQHGIKNGVLLKDEFGGRVVRVKGVAKVMCHLMFGILALTSNQMMCFLE